MHVENWFFNKIKNITGHAANSLNKDRCKLTVICWPIEVCFVPRNGLPVLKVYNNFPVITASCKLLTLNRGL
ncbi:MAG: hypothetical protein JWR09_1459 [Mucilaginibacter sp.]|nr:hypothetical protein [Mucilaginibacter sp.]